MLFEPLIAGPLRLPNRTMRSPTWEGIATPAGQMTNQLFVHMDKLARGGVGFLCFSCAKVTMNGGAGTQLGMYSDHVAESYVPFLQMLKENHPQTVFGIQLGHAGRTAMECERLGPSDVKLRNEYHRMDLPDCHALTAVEIGYMVDEFVNAAVRAKRVGFDVVMFHAAHGYLLESFLSPLYNKRTDEYGGSVENRVRILLEIVRKTREAVGPDFPLAVKMNISDNAEGGLTLEDSTQMAVLLAEAGVSLLETSSGCGVSRLSAIRCARDFSPCYHKEGGLKWVAALKAKGLTNTVVALSGGVRQGKEAEGLIASGACHLVSMSRSLIREPDLVNKWKGSTEYKAKCINCGRCLELVSKGLGYRCVFNKI